MSNLVPYVIERSGQVERTFDIYSKLLKERIVFIDGEITDAVASLVVSQLIFLEADNPNKEINLYINSPGGSVTAGLAIYDTIKYISSPVKTICMGQAASMAAIILAAGEKGSRHALPSSRVMIHQPFGGVEGQASDIQVQTEEIIRLKKLTIKYLAADCGKEESEVEKDILRDKFMTAEETMNYGIIDSVITRK
ncbi:MAG: ATP-dependent Clp protease proteolytic subunit [Sphaerochaetaceae bacterium]|nr:ATP-dependent Clp protease proteolytic subunit [Spirochaetales bacterium]MDY5967572.1 ATP-dependent Clp protease proteolytic subunit [Sphaerochaetaceae bacterium]